MSDCPCGSGKDFAECCEPILNGEPAATPEALMRARYTAHAKNAFDFLETSLHPSVHETVDKNKMREWSEAVTWEGMDVHQTTGGGENDNTGTVSFTARYSVNGVEQELREDATFTRETGQWLYLDGDVHGHTPYRRESPKIGRNDPCPCGSGKKYKKCCG